MSKHHIDCNIHINSYRKSAAEENEYGDISNTSNKPLGLKGVFSFSYDYPLSTTAMFNHTLNPSMSARDILAFGRDDYRRIYREEDRDVGKPTKNIPGMLNRDTSEGRYGIWGHDISDLFFEGININTAKKTIDFDTGS